MKASCNVIKDLLILYEDDACSDDSKKMVEEHLKSCQTCNTYFQKLQCTEDMISGEMIEEFAPEDKAMKHSLKKIKRRWVASLVAIFMIIPLIGLGIMGYHEAHDDGIAFSNLDDLYRCMKYLKYIEKKEFEKAAEMVDFYRDGSAYEGDIPEYITSMTPEEYQSYMKERFIAKFQEYDALGIYIDNISYDSAYRANGDRWTICVAFDENYPDGSEQKMIVHLNGETMFAGAYAYPYTGNIRMDTYIDEVLYLYSEDDVLEYREMEVTFELKEGEKAIITWTEEMEAELDLLNVGLFNTSYVTGTTLLQEPYNQKSFITSVPGTYSICGFTSERGRVFLTEEDVDIQIIKYE